MKTHKSWWDREVYLKHKAKRHNRAKIIAQIRNFFDGLGFLEVETPAIQVCPGMEVHLKAFKTSLVAPFGENGETRYLHTSPELSMKKLLVAGEEKIMQLCHTYRNEESGQTHSPEFLMLEWYRTNTDYTAMMNDTENLIHELAKQNNVSTVSFNDMTADICIPFERLSVTDAFLKYADIDLNKTLPLTSTLEPDPSLLSQEAARIGIKTPDTDRYEDIFFRIMLDKIEPFLGNKKATILYDYPTCLGALARKKENDERFVERFELYICGVELCNAFSELTDAEEQRTRFLYDQLMKQELYGETYPVDEDFLNALRKGLPPCSGNALGVDRLVMLLTNAEKIDDILWVPIL